jgi:hypothetical protein
MEQRMSQRRRFKQFTSLHDRLESEAQRLREQARVLPPGVQRSDLLHRIEKFERAIGINRWLSSPGLEFSDATTGSRTGATVR